MGWVLRLVETGADSPGRSVEVMEVSRPHDLGDIANLGLTLPEAKQILARVQQAVVAVQAEEHAVARPDCSCCGGGCHIQDWRVRQVATLFGLVAVRLPRFRCVSCRHGETGTSWPSHCRSTPELDQLRAHLAALLPYRVAAGVLTHLLPVDGGTSPETLRSHTLKIGEQLRVAAAGEQAAAASSITVTVDSTFIRSCDDGERHLEVRVGNVETSDGRRQVFGAVAKTETDIAVLIRRSLEAVGRTADTMVTAFTDGCCGLRSILAAAGAHEAANSRLVPHRHAAAACQAGGEWVVHRRTRPDASQDRHRRRGRASALADLERQSQGRADHARTDTQGHARLQRRARSSRAGRAIPQAVACVACGR